MRRRAKCESGPRSSLTWNICRTGGSASTMTRAGRCVFNNRYMLYMEGCAAGHLSTW